MKIYSYTDFSSYNDYIGFGKVSDAMKRFIVAGGLATSALAPTDALTHKDIGRFLDHGYTTWNLKESDPNYKKAEDALASVFGDDARTWKTRDIAEKRLNAIADSQLNNLLDEHERSISKVAPQTAVDRFKGSIYNRIDNFKRGRRSNRYSDVIDKISNPNSDEGVTFVKRLLDRETGEDITPPEAIDRNEEIRRFQEIPKPIQFRPYDFFTPIPLKPVIKK